MTMPYSWTDTASGTGELQAWPHQSLPPKGFVLFISVTTCMILIPLVSLMGTVVFWGLLPFLLLALGAIWWALQRNWRDQQILEILRISHDEIKLTRHNPRGADQNWACNTYWAETLLHVSGGPVPQYLTLRGNGREVELGRFLSEEERRILYGDLRERLARFKRP